MTEQELLQDTHGYLSPEVLLPKYVNREELWAWEGSLR